MRIHYTEGQKRRSSLDNPAPRRIQEAPKPGPFNGRIDSEIRTDFTDGKGELIFYTLRPNLDPDGKAETRFFLPDGTPTTPEQAHHNHR